MNGKTLLIFIIFFTTTFSAYGGSEVTKKLIQNVYTDFEAGKYSDVIQRLELFAAKNEHEDKSVLGLVYYWMAMSYTKLNDFEKAEDFFIKSLSLGYRSQDIYYEYGQVLYVASKYKRARIAFKKSVQEKYKIGVSLYYIAFISQELKDYKKAVSFYNMIEKLPKAESKDVLQAARMQVGDIYLSQIERQRDPFQGIEKYVVPQYNKALAFDGESALAAEIKQKIESLQRKYELILFKMRNGKPTSRPPHYLKANILYGSNNNATANSDPTSDDVGTYIQTGIFSRYSFYPNSSFSYAPEISASYTKYNSDSTSLLPLNNYYIKTALKMNYEHLYKKDPATFYIDFDYTYNADDADADKSFAVSDNTYGVTLSEELVLWKNNPSTFRFRYEQVAAEEESSKKSSMTLTYEQPVILKWATLFFYNSYAVASYTEADTSNTNILTNRLDTIFPTFYGLFNPTVYISNTATNYINDSDKGTPNLISYGLNLNRPVGKNLYLTFDYGMSSQKADLDSLNYTQQLMTLNLDLIY